MKNLNYNWKLSEAEFTKDKGKVFSCFACGGGSTMGYKLAGFDVLGCNEIDPKMIEAYKVNHNPKYAYLEPIQTFKLRKDLPKELYNLDILDGSPPCSSFSMAGNRGDDWGKEKKFREGQAEQVLDTLFFDFIDLAKELQPKIVVAENVKGLLLGEARNYVRRILKEFDEAGYYVVYNLLDASKMGVPQRRERVFFTAIRKDLSKNILKQIDMFTYKPYLKLEFNENPIFFKDFYKENNVNDRPITAQECLKLWNLRKPGDLDMSYSAQRLGKIKFWNYKYLIKDKIPLTFPSGKDSCFLFDEPRRPNKYEVCCIGAFPQDYNFNKTEYSYLIGMSVPPLMTARLANEIYNQWLTKIN
jgi:DNA (cytosine-5)-methyltransferase 1